MNKKNIADLAIFGGTPVFDEKLHVGRPNIGNQERLFERLHDILDRKWLTNDGIYVKEFERKVAELIGVKHCIAVSSGTSGLEVAIRALGLRGEVIVPSFTFVATVHALQWLGIRPVFCDVDRASHDIDPKNVEKLITSNTTGIMGVHLWGRPCEVQRLEEIAHKNNVKLLFDAAHAFGASCKGQMIGNFGNAEVFSFHATKFLNCLEGGAIATNDDELASKIRLMKNFGFSGYDNVISVGTNAKLDEFSAAMGLTGLESMDEFIAINQRNYKQYEKESASLPGITLTKYDEREKTNYQYIVFEIDHRATKLTRDQLVNILHAENVLVKRYYYPGCHRCEPYQSDVSYSGLKMPNTEYLTQSLMNLPTGTAIGGEQINTICQIIRFAIQHGEEIKKKVS
ncbi:aminotransferase class I/II-fold pyridoxal phosphate-dependent enzyme [Candidatus Omnitrophota bacterium]